MCAGVGALPIVLAACRALVCVVVSVAALAVCRRLVSGVAL